MTACTRDASEVPDGRTAGAGAGASALYAGSVDGPNLPESGPQAALLRELAPGIGVDDVRALTGAPLEPSAIGREWSRMVERSRDPARLVALAEALDTAMRIKPERHHFVIDKPGGAPALARHMSMTGG